VAQRLSVSKDWVYRNGNKLTFTRKIGPKLVRFSEAGLQKWLKMAKNDNPL
jgi:predicted DNA-binding transcriptional regulator AlpA